MRWLLPFTLSCGLFAQAAPTYRLPSHGFLPFSGDDPEAIFTTRDLIIGNSSILNGRDNRGSTLRFVGTRANPPVFSTPYPTPVSLYSGNPDQWRHRQSTYARVQLGEWYPGISAEWNMENDAAVLRLDVSPGVDPRILRIYSDDGTYGSCRLFGVEITCTAYQADAAGHRTTIPINFEFVRDQPSVISFGGIHAPNAPITLEFRFRRGNEVSDAKFAADGSLFLLHEQGFVKFDPQGTPLFETRFRGLLGIRLVLSDSQSIIVIGGLNRFDRGSPNWPALPEPRQRFVAQFDPRGQIVSGLYGSGLIFAAFAANGDMVLGKAATGRPDYSVVGRWTPGRAALDTETFLPGDLHNLAANPTGHVTCLLYPRSRSVGSASTTPGALEQTYRGQHQLYAVNLTPDLSRQVWATFLPMLPNAEGMNGLRVSGMELDANGELLVAATATYPYTFGGSWEGTANVLHRLAADGSRYVYSESLPGSDFRLILHRDDSVWVHGRAPKNNLPTSPQAPLRGGCYGLLGSYVASRSRTGTFLQGSYLRDGNAITVSPSGQYLYQWRRSDPAVGQFAPTALDSAGGTPAYR